MLLFTLIFGIVLLPKGYTLKCYQCTMEVTGTCTETTMQCPSSAYQCSAVRVISYAGGNKVDVSAKSCALPEECIQGSVNFGISRTVITSRCCSSDLCNTQNAPDPGTSSANGKKCFACDRQNCSTLLNCQDDEDHCIKATAAVGIVKVTMKGCASKSICSNTQSSQLSKVIGAEVSCCQGDYCNSASSTRAGLLLLVTPLIHLVLFS